MTDNEKTEKYALHAIQLIDVRVLELQFSLSRHPEEKELRFSQKGYSLSGAHTDYDPEDSTIFVTVKLELGDESGEDQSVPFFLRVQIGGLFEVDETQFPIDKLDWWARYNAPIVLFPYIREQAYGLSSRAGLPPIILPLLQVPTVKVDA